MIKKSLSSGCPRNSIIFILWITFFIFFYFTALYVIRITLER